MSLAHALENEKLTYIYSRKAAIAITGREDVEEVEVWKNKCCLVKFSKGSRLVSQRKFKEYFAESRRQRSRGIQVTQHIWDKEQFTARSQRNENETYNLKAYPDFIYCECKDWEIQKEIGIKKPCCKHAYAALRLIGCGSLYDYIHTGSYYSLMPF